MEKEKWMEGFREWLIENERSENTIDNYIKAVKIFFSQYEELTKENMISFKQNQLESRSPRTAANRCIAMNQFCKFLEKPELCIKSIKIHRASYVENVISLREYEELLEKLKADKRERDYWMVKFLAKTGARVSEFVKLDKTGLEKGYCEMWTKGKIRRIYIPENLIIESKEYFDTVQGELLFPNRYGTRMTERGVAENLVRMSKKYGIRKEVMHPHAFRHLYAIEFLKKNPNIALLADLMGHASVDTTSVYLKLSREEQMRQFNEASGW